LPKPWAESPALRKKARIPEEVQFRTKLQIAIDMVDTAIANDVPRGVALADAWYGTNKEFRQHLSKNGLAYAVGVDSETRVVCIQKRGRYGERITVQKLAASLDRTMFRRVRWREGTRRGLESDFYVSRVAVDYGSEAQPDLRAEWLIIEWPKNEDEPSNYSLSTLPATMGKRQLIHILKERWRTERAYEELKGELGLDHFEGRSYPGWHHHVSVVLCCYAFVVAERIRTFPPSLGGTSPASAFHFAA
jgi:SRSO17 transposase